MDNKVKNTVTIKIDNCKDCKYHCVNKVFAPSTCRSLSLVCCTKALTENTKHYAVESTINDNVYEYSQIPDWCPLLENRDNTKIEENTYYNNNDIKIVVLVGFDKEFNDAISSLVSNKLREQGFNYEDISIFNKSITKYHGKELENVNIDCLEEVLHLCYASSEYIRYKRIIIKVSESKAKLKEIKDICSKYNNCEVVFTFDGKSVVTAENLKSVVNNAASKLID